MRFLRAGASATEAIEASLRILEDKEITNAGYGSNLSIDGTVECDATIVNHIGRSGACGAVPGTPHLRDNTLSISDEETGIRNPISLAKLILDMSNKPLSLRRVPPNALVGEGAKMFAKEHGMATYTNERLVSKNARDRFLRWQEDLKRAEGKSQDLRSRRITNPPTPEPKKTQAEPTSPPPSTILSIPRDHAAAIATGTFNEGQPDSPGQDVPRCEVSPGCEGTHTINYKHAASSATTNALHGTPPLSEPAPSVDQSSPNRQKLRLAKAESVAANMANKSDASLDNQAAPRKDSNGNKRRSALQSDSVPNGYCSSQSSLETMAAPSGTKRPLTPVKEGESTKRPTKKYGHPILSHAEGEDVITDTVGAIAIDNKGHIAAGSSSGGIGMKHRGRLGPAALVGIGTAVVPCDPEDEDGVTVAAVTSGTGEHMATTMASQRCAERVYRGSRKGTGSVDIADDDENVIMESFISNDFMNHAGVQNCHSTGAIGVMVVKKAKSGCYFYFAHNTDSFALASMGGTDKKPVCVMSRLPKGADIAKGGRKIRME